MTQPTVLLGMALLAMAAVAAAQDPQWIGAAVPPASDAATFEGTLDLPGVPTVALARVAAYDRYRLVINGTPVAIGDTPWDAETHDVARFLHAGSNRVEITASAEVARPRNCWLWLRRDLPTPGSFERLSFRTRGATGNEWLYIELRDTAGHSSGFYCLERKRPDLALGRSGEPADHTIDLRTEPRLDYRPKGVPAGDFDFNHLASVAIRVDQKDVTVCPAGQVEISNIRLSGETEVDISDAGSWRMEAGSGEWRRSVLEPADGGGLRLRYDFLPAPDAKISVDIRAWREGGEIGRLVSGPSWRSGGVPVRITESPANSFAWTRRAVAGPEEKPAPAFGAGVMLDLGGVDRCSAGESLPAEVRIWALQALPGVQAQIVAENWSGVEVFRAEVPVQWDGATGKALFQTPVLPRGLYRFTATLPGTSIPDRHTALAVLAPGATELPSVFDTLTPIGYDGPMRGFDLSWSNTPAQMLGIRDQGINFLQVHLSPGQLDNGEYAGLLAFCKATGLHFALNNEHCNWVASAPDPSGRERFDAAGGCHRWDLEGPALDAAAATGLFEGVVYDEGEHMQLCRNNYAKLPDREHRMPYLVETTGMTLPQAYDAFLAAAREVNTYNRSHGARMLVESVFPALWHPLARAGVTLCPKLLKEDIYPVVLALALGAANQYDAELWFSPDYWLMDRFPGHTVEEYATALRLAHLAGVDNVYTEHSMGMLRTRGATYELTPYGAALRAFMEEYLPAHPREYTYRDFEPEVAIIRFPDSDWGQASCYYWDTLYGAEDLPPTPETGEWMQVFNLLTGGRTDPRAVNTNSAVYPRYDWPNVIPSPPTAVFDHLVGEQHLRTARTLFLCGITISPETLGAVRNRVREGAICFTPARLAPPDVQRAGATLPARVDEGAGAWIVVPAFTREGLGAYADLLPAVGDTMRLRFKGRDVHVSNLH
jgi:hypothetical protein